MYHKEVQLVTTGESGCNDTKSLDQEGSRTSVLFTMNMCKLDTWVAKGRETDETNNYLINTNSKQS